MHADNRPDRLNPDFDAELLFQTIRQSAPLLSAINMMHHHAADLMPFDLLSHAVHDRLDRFFLGAHLGKDIRHAVINRQNGFNLQKRSQ